MVRQYKIHTDLDGANNKIWDVTNGKVRLYQPSDLGIEVSNNLWGSDGIGVMGERSISQPDIKFTLITLGSSVQENYKLLNEFINDILSVKYVTLEYRTEWFQVYADVALNKITKTEGYGLNGTFEEEITFNIITKWYTYENLTFTTLENGEIIDGVSKVYGGSYYSIPKNLYPNTDFKDGFNGWTRHPSLDIWEILSEDESDKTSKILHGKGATQTNQQLYTPTHNVPVSPGDTFTISFDYKDLNWTKPIVIASVRVTATPSSNTGIESFNFSSDKATTKWEKKVFTLTATQSGFLSVMPYDNDNTGNHESFYKKLKVEKGDKATPWIPDTIDTAGYRYIKGKAYTYYGETNIGRLSRWEITEPFFSIVAKLIPSKVIDGTNQVGLKFFNENLNEYSAILFNVDTPPDYIMVNTDVNDEFYLSATKGTTINAFPSIDMQRYRTRIFTKGQMTLQNVSSVEIRVKRKVDFI